MKNINGVQVSRKYIRQIAGTFQNGFRTKEWCKLQAMKYLKRHLH